MKKENTNLNKTSKESLFNIKDLINIKDKVYEIRYIDENTIACFNLLDNNDALINPRINKISWIEKDDFRLNIDTKNDVFNLSIKDKSFIITIPIDNYSYKNIEDIYNKALYIFEESKIGFKNIKFLSDNFDIY